MKATKRIGLAMILCVAAVTAGGVLAQQVPPPAPPSGVRVDTSMPSTSGGFATGGQKPYTPGSPWNTPIPANAAVDANSANMIATITANGSMRSDPSQYTYPLYITNSSSSRVTFTCSGTISVNNTDGSRTTVSSLPGVPVPSGMTASTGSDAQIIIIDGVTGDEYDIWKFVSPSGCTNMTKYVNGVNRSAVENSYVSRGAGVPYFAGLIRPWEVAAGQINHALAFAYNQPKSGRCVYPASKTDGSSSNTYAIPEGARLQLDPSLDVNSISGLSATGKMIARALQVYGAYVIDYSGSNKIYPESNLTASWGTTLTASTVSPIPASRLRVLQLPAGFYASSYSPNHGSCVQ